MAVPFWRATGGPFRQVRTELCVLLVCPSPTLLLFFISCAYASNSLLFSILLHFIRDHIVTSLLVCGTTYLEMLTLLQMLAMKEMLMPLSIISFYCLLAVTFGLSTCQDSCLCCKAGYEILLLSEMLCCFVLLLYKLISVLFQNSLLLEWHSIIVHSKFNKPQSNEQSNQSDTVI